MTLFHARIQDAIQQDDLIIRSIDLLDLDAAPLPAAEVETLRREFRRASIRLACAAELQLVEEDNTVVDLEFVLLVNNTRTTAEHIALVDFAENGVGFITSAELVAGEEVSICAMREDDVEPAFLASFRVINCQPAAQGGYLCGAERLQGDMAPLFKAVLDSRYVQHMADIRQQN